MERMSFLASTFHDSHDLTFNPDYYTGEAIEGMDIVMTIEALGSQSGRPSKTIVVSESGTV